jgi:hypothetical protein
MSSGVRVGSAGGAEDFIYGEESDASSAHGSGSSGQGTVHGTVSFIDNDRAGRRVSILIGKYEVEKRAGSAPFPSS